MILIRDVSSILLLGGVALVSTIFRVSKGVTLLRLYPASYDGCLDACLHHENCQRAVVNRWVNLCELQDANEPSEDQNLHGSLVVDRNYIKESKMGPPCSTTSIKTNTTACPFSEFAGQARLGNMNGAGDKTIVDLGTNISVCNLATFTCGNGGQWVLTECTNHSRLQAQQRSSSPLNATGQPRDCNDLFEGGQVVNGIYNIFPEGKHAKKVFCELYEPDGPWTVIQRRVDDTVSFYRSFKQYQEGFGDLSGNFWLGLDSISAITILGEQTYSLKIVIVDIVSGVTFAKYSYFKVMNESQGYALYVHGYSGTAGDALKGHNGYQFTTYDHDRDANQGNCAIGCTGAWWFTNCVFSNLNGMYGEKDVCQGINWGPATGYHRSAIFVIMKLQKQIA